MSTGDDDQERRLLLAAEVLSRVLAIDERDQLDVLAYVCMGWCRRRDMLAEVRRVEREIAARAGAGQ